jgi:alpha-D-ribose 1-methylphosphonate 5-triphosphate synthase subunit PhnH
VQQAEAAPADFVAVRAGEADLAALRLGSDEVPQQGATLIVEVPTLAVERHASLRLTGPGIEHEQRMGLCGLSVDFWQQRIGLQRAFPRGVDLLLVCGSQIVGVPRSTLVTLEGT